MRKINTRASVHPTPVRGRAEPPPAMPRHAEELMELAVEAAQSRHLPNFLEQFALRSTRMLDALWGGVAVCRGRETELHAMPGGAPTTEAVANWLILCARGSQNDVTTLALPQVFDAAIQLHGRTGPVVF